MKYLSKVVGIYLAFLMQSLILENIKILSCSPDVLLTAVIICAVSSDCIKAAALGSFAGLLTDVLCGRVFGVNILIYMYLSLIVSIAVNEKTKNSPLLMSWIAFICVAALEMVITVLKSMLGYHPSIGFLGAKILVKGVFAALFTLMFVIICEHLKKRREKAKDSVKEDAV